MIQRALKFLTEQINVFLDQVKKTDDDVISPVAILQNISRLDKNELATTNKILISLVNLTEEVNMKNSPGYRSPGIHDGELKNPPVTLNLYILVTAVMTNYENALIYLSHVLTFFHDKSIFTSQSSLTEVKEFPEDFRIFIDLYSLTLDQTNNLWSTLGGKQQPFICYQVRLRPV
jgi:hypothetical protein